MAQQSRVAFNYQPRSIETLSVGFIKQLSLANELSFQSQATGGNEKICSTCVSQVSTDDMQASWLTQFSLI